MSRTGSATAPLPPAAKAGCSYLASSNRQRQRTPKSARGPAGMLPAMAQPATAEPGPLVGRPGSPSGCPTWRQPSRRCGSTRRCSGPGPGRPSPGSTAPPPGSSTSPAGRGPDGVPAGPALPGRRPGAAARPRNPRTAQGPFGEKSVIEFPGYQPPAWLDAAHRRPAATGMAVPSRVLGARVPIERGAAPAATPRRCRCWSSDGPSTPATPPCSTSSPWPAPTAACRRCGPPCWPRSTATSTTRPPRPGRGPGQRGPAGAAGADPDPAGAPPGRRPGASLGSATLAAARRPGQLRRPVPPVRQLLPAGPDDHERDFPASGGSPASSTTWPPGPAPPSRPRSP